MDEKICVAHSPDPDDAFMHYAVAEGKIDTGRYSFETATHDIESLNHAARVGRHEVCAISTTAYAYVADRYALLGHGGSLGEGYGPVLIARTEMSTEQLAGGTVAIPGFWTTAALLLKLLQPDVKFLPVPFSLIPTVVTQGPQCPVVEGLGPLFPALADTKIPAPRAFRKNRSVSEKLHGFVPPEMEKLMTSTPSRIA